jgi:predicted transposase/invertase (TIGR01784 family)
LQEGIAYQNKDVLFKVISEVYKSKSLKVYGLDLPPIKEVLPTSLPMIKADEMRADNIFLLEGDTILIVEYKSASSTQDIFQCGFYGFRVADTYFKGADRKLIIVIIYTGDVDYAPAKCDMGSIQICVEQVFLSKLDGNAMYKELKHKVEAGEPLSDEDIMRFIILPLTEKAGNQARVESVIELAKEIKDERTQVFVIAGILTATDKFINKEYANSVKEWLKMTKVARLYEEEKIDAVNKAVNKAVKEAVDNRCREIAKNLLEAGMDFLDVMKATHLTREEIDSLR